LDVSNIGRHTYLLVKVIHYKIIYTVFLTTFSVRYYLNELNSRYVKDAEFDTYTQEGTLSAAPNQIRRLLVTFLTFSDPVDVTGLHSRYFEVLADDQRLVMIF